MIVSFLVHCLSLTFTNTEVKKPKFRKNYIKFSKGSCQQLYATCVTWIEFENYFISEDVSEMSDYNILQLFEQRISSLYGITFLILAEKNLQNR